MPTVVARKAPVRSIVSHKVAPKKAPPKGAPASEATPGGASSPERIKVDAQLAMAEKLIAPFMGPNIEGSLDLSGVTAPAGWEGVRDRMRALLGSAASLATSYASKAKAAARDAASAIQRAAGAAATAVRAQLPSVTGAAKDALQTLWEHFKSMQRAALNIAGGITLALALAAAYLLFSRFGGKG